MWRIFSTVFLVSLFSLGMISCEKKPESAAQGGKLVFFMVPKGVNPYYGPCYQGFQDAAKKFGVDVELNSPTKFELPLQVEVLENIIAKKPAGIAISAVDDQGLKNVIEKATAAGIKVITFDAPAPSTEALSYIGTLNDVAGYQAGVEMAKAMNYEGKVAILQGGLGSSNLNDRYAGFTRAIAEKAPKITVVAREDTKGLNDEAVNKVENILTANPDLNGIFSVSAEGVPAAAAVLKRLNKSGVVVAGFDDQPETLAAIRAGSCKFCLVQRTYKMGWMSVEKLVDACNGKPLDKQYDTGVILVTKDNVDSYMKDAMAEFQTTDKK